MLKKVCFTIVLGVLISYPLAAATLSEDVALAKPSKLGTLRIAVGQETGVTYTEILGDRLTGEKGLGPGSYGECSADIKLHGSTQCPTCNNCPDPEAVEKGEILLLCLCFEPSDEDLVVLPTAGQKYGFELINPQDIGSAVSATHEIVCHQQDPADGYEFGHLYHCGVAISVKVNSCGHFEIWYDLMGTLWDSTP